MKKLRIIGVAFITLAIFIFAGCADSIDACPTVEGENATTFTGHGYYGTPVPGCYGYVYGNRKACPDAPLGWRILYESQNTNGSITCAYGHGI